MADLKIEKMRQQHKRLNICEFDLTLARHHAQHMLKEGMFLYRDKENVDLYYQQAAFVCALVVSYGRVFNSSDGLSLFKKKQAHYDGDENKLHDELIRLRNKLYAHSDGDLFHVRTIGRGINIRRLPQYRIKKDDLELLLTMIEKLSGNVLGRRQKLQEQISKSEKS